jgi:hypothetical protein
VAIPLRGCSWTFQLCLRMTKFLHLLGGEALTPAAVGDLGQITKGHLARPGHIRLSSSRQFQFVLDIVINIRNNVGIVGLPRIAIFIA